MNFTDRVFKISNVDIFCSFSTGFLVVYGGGGGRLHHHESMRRTLTLLCLFSPTSPLFNCVLLSSVRIHLNLLNEEQVALDSLCQLPSSISSKLIPPRWQLHCQSPVAADEGCRYNSRCSWILEQLLETIGEISCCLHSCMYTLSLGDRVVLF